MAREAKAATKPAKRDVGNKLDELALDIKAEHREVGAALRKSLDHARKAGELLARAKQQIEALPEYKWGGWVSKTCEIHERTANNYIRIHRQWAKIEQAVKGDIANLTVRAALAVIKKVSESEGDAEKKHKKVPLTMTALKELLARLQIDADPVKIAVLLKEVGKPVADVDGEAVSNEEQ
jgi:hypothetical protein